MLRAGRLQRKVQAKTGTLGKFAFDEYVTAVFGHNLFADGKPQAGSPLPFARFKYAKDLG